MGLEDDVQLISSFRVGDQGMDVIAELAHEKGHLRLVCEIRSKMAIRLVKEGGVPLADSRFSFFGKEA